MPTLTRTEHGPTVVLVDDDAALRTALSFMLELDGFTVVTLESGEALLGYALPAAPACLVLDQNLEGITGIDALSRLRARDVTLPALLITSHPTAAMKSAAAALDAIIVEKPLLTDSLLSGIVAALDRDSDRLGKF